MKKIKNYKTFLENMEYEKNEDILKAQRPDNIMPEKIEEYCLQCIRLTTNVLVWHLQTNSFSEHEALGELYKELADKVDQAVEITINLKGSLSKDLSYQMEILPIPDMIDELENFKEMLDEFEDEVDEDSLEAVIDEILIAVDETLYKLNHLK